MPNYGSSRSRGNAGGKAESGIAGFFKRREQRKKQLKEESARLITNKLADNERLFVDNFNAIDFRNSKIPKEVLNEKTKEEQPCGDLEYFARVCVKHLQQNPQVIKCDIRDIDEKLMELILVFKQSIENGYPRAAYACRYALKTGLCDIRERIPVGEPELIKQFVEVHTKYLEQWLSCIEMARLVDEREERTNKIKTLYENEVTTKNEEAKKVLEEFKSNSAKARAFDFIKEHDSKEDRAKWTDLQNQVHEELVDAMFNRVMLDLTRLDYMQQKQQLQIIMNQFDQFQLKLYSTEIVVDPNLINKYREAMEEMFMEFSKNDVALQEALASIDDYSSRVEALMNAKGQQMLNSRASREAERLLEEARRTQQEAVNKGAGGQTEDVGMKNGILSDEEIAEMQKHQETINNSLNEFVEQTIVEEEDEGEDNLN